MIGAPILMSCEDGKRAHFAIEVVQIDDSDPQTLFVQATSRTSGEMVVMLERPGEANRAVIEDCDVVANHTWWNNNPMFGVLTPKVGDIIHVLLRDRVKVRWEGANFKLVNRP
jgi:hypothetical protein